MSFSLGTILKSLLSERNKAILSATKASKPDYWKISTTKTSTTIARPFSTSWKWLITKSPNESHREFKKVDFTLQTDFPFLGITFENESVNGQIDILSINAPLPHFWLFFEYFHLLLLKVLAVHYHIFLIYLVHILLVRGLVLEK